MGIYQIILRDIEDNSLKYSCLIYKDSLKFYHADVKIGNSSIKDIIEPIAGIKYVLDSLNNVEFEGFYGKAIHQLDGYNALLENTTDISIVEDYIKNLKEEIREVTG